MPTTKPPTEDDELDDLPPIDGEAIDEEEDDGAEELDDEPADGGDPMDDSTGEGDPLEEIEVSGAESGWLEDAGESDALDVGTPETFGTEEESPTLLEGAEEPDLGEDELPFGGGGEEDSLVGDAGEEGFEDEEEDLREEDLPRLDSGQDDTESDDADLLEGLPDEEVSEEPRPPWDDRAWERVEGSASDLAAVNVMACGADGLVVGGQGLARVDGKGEGVVALEAIGLRGGAPRGVVIDGDWICVTTPRAGLLVSEDAGKSFHEANGWRPLLVPSDAEGALEIVFVGGELWGRGAGGALVWSGDRGASWSQVLPDYRFEAIAGDSAKGQVVALAREVPATTIARGAAGKLVVSSTGPLPAGKILSLAAYDGRTAIALGRGVFRVDGAGDAGRERAGEREWARLDGTAGLTAMTFARGDGTLLIALHSEGEGRAWLLEARGGAPAFIVAEMGDSGASASANEEGDDARVRALCWDEGLGMVWAAGGFGLVALRPARHH